MCCNDPGIDPYRIIIDQSFTLTVLVAPRASSRYVAINKKRTL
jgi:hypothetical protein